MRTRGRYPAAGQGLSSASSRHRSIRRCHPKIRKRHARVRTQRLALCGRHRRSLAAMPSVAGVTYIPLRALAVNVIAFNTRARRKRRKPDSMTAVEPLVERLYSLDELLELRRDMLRFARFLPQGPRRNELRQTASSLRALLKRKDFLDANTPHVRQTSVSRPVYHRRRAPRFHRLWLREIAAEFPEQLRLGI